MQQPLDFDPHYYFGIVAENLLKNLGPKALEYADEALKKMRALGDDEGFDMWVGISEHLNAQARQASIPMQAVVH
ncbi:hypothetical protein GCM10017044_08950 [Kordiimonas sediminis]|uniref:Uncharacterized protein n=1 Tax=Kordiimonas sediminis TaxID=1735581 RepID=A0A919ANT2_9PROT|nr:hypothetical protein [Kordiimonas sediminis]GHF16809.1 hypothetical protein GCM10017044_08950 [Kordiimonas sediminis]